MAVPPWRVLWLLALSPNAVAMTTTGGASSAPLAGQAWPGRATGTPVGADFLCQKAGKLRGFRAGWRRD